MQNIQDMYRVISRELIYKSIIKKYRKGCLWNFPLLDIGVIPTLLPTLGS